MVIEPPTWPPPREQPAIETAALSRMVMFEPRLLPLPSRPRKPLADELTIALEAKVTEPRGTRKICEPIGALPRNMSEPPSLPGRHCALPPTLMLPAQTPVPVLVAIMFRSAVEAGM